MMIMKEMICENLKSEGGFLRFADRDLAVLAERFGTPLYLMDADRIRERCRMYMKAVSTCFPPGSKVVYASKAASFKYMYRIMRQEGMCVDVVSNGEIATAKSVCYDMKNAYYHSNVKTDEEIAYAIESGVGTFVVDSLEELEAINNYFKRMNAEEEVHCTQDIMLRLTPGIDPHTFEAVNTGKVDTKFGFGISTGQAEEALRLALLMPYLHLVGFHCHVGSQVFDSEVYIKSADIMLEFVKFAKEKYDYKCGLLNLGGGYGVRYTENDPVIDIEENIKQLAAHIEGKCAELNIDVPPIALEPGRSIVADAGLTLYHVGSVKRIPGYTTYVSVDGGMTDNVRYAMYQAPYTVVAPEKMNEEDQMLCTLAGRCCESGDVIQPNVYLPKSLKRGDLIAVLTTGAYNYSMASNYNRIPRPALVMLDEGTERMAVKRESFADLLLNDI